MAGYMDTPNGGPMTSESARDVSDQCATCGASPSSRLAVIRENLNLSRVIREFDEQSDEANALLRAALPLLRDKYVNLGLVADIEEFLVSPKDGTP